MKKIEKYDLSMINPEDPKSFDLLKLDKRDFLISFIKFLLVSLIAIFIFFIPLGSDGSIAFGIIYNKLIDIINSLVVINGVEVGALLVCTIILMGTGLASIYGKYFSSNDSRAYKYFEKDSVVHPILYMLGGIFILLYFLDQVGWISGPEFIVSDNIAGMVIPGVVIGVAAIIPVGAFFIPFLIDYGLIDFIGVFLERIMRPLFKIPGKAAIDTVTSFVGSTTMGIILTGKMYKSNNYTGKEAGIVATCFSAVSIGYAYVVMGSAQITKYFVITYFISFFITFIIGAIICRIPPVSKIESRYYNGKLQTQEDIEEEKYKFGPEMARVGINRAVNKAYYSGNLLKRSFKSIVESFPVMPKVITLICSFGILGMILAAYTPIFQWIGYLILPLVKALGVPDPMAAAAAIPSGITEMYIPVLTIANSAADLALGTRFFIVVVSMVQIIFLAESIVVIINMDIPVKFHELLIVFVERTIIAMPLAAIFMHLLF